MEHDIHFHFPLLTVSTSKAKLSYVTTGEKAELHSIQIIPCQFVFQWFKYEIVRRNIVDHY